MWPREAPHCCNLQGEFLIEESGRGALSGVWDPSAPLLPSEWLIRGRTGVLLKENCLVPMNVMGLAV